MARPSERLILLLLAAIQFTHIMDFMIMMPMGPQLMRELSIGAGAFSAFVAAYSIAAGVIGFVSAPFIDRFDRRPLLLIAYSGFAVSTLLCGIAQDNNALLVGRILGGAFGGISGSLCMMVVSDVVPPERRASGIGVVMTAFALAAALGVPVGLELAQRFGWRMPFLLLAVTAAVVWIAVWRILPPLRDHLEAPGDRRRAFFELLRDSNAGRALVFMFSMVLGHFTIIPLLSPHLVSNVGLPERYLVLVYMIGGILSVFTAPKIGRLADRLGRQKMFAGLVVIASLVILALAHLPPTAPWLVLILTGAFFVFASGRFVPGQAIITLAVPVTRRGAFLSLSSCARDLASGISSSLGGWIVVKTPTGKLANFHWLGWIALAFGLLSIWLSRRVRVNDVTALPGNPVRNHDETR